MPPTTHKPEMTVWPVCPVCGYELEDENDFQFMSFDLETILVIAVCDNCQWSQTLNYDRRRS